MKEEITAPHPDGQRLLFLRRHYIKFLLIFFLLFGFYLRAYHIDYPSVGYHNMKENNYLSITTNYYKKGLSIHREVFFYGSEDPPYHEEYPQLPIIPYVGYFLWNVFGVSFWIMRLQIILFSLGTVVLAFFLTKRLTQEPNLSLLTAGVMTILPINVFYGRNIQPESPALFFMMLFFLLFLRWKESPSFRKSFFAGLTLAVIGLYKVSFLVPCVAVLAIFPYRQLFEDIKTKNFMPYIGYLSFLVLPVFILLVALSNVHASLLKGTAHRIRFLEFLDPAYWRTNYPFFENFWIGNYTSFLGLIFVLGVMVLFIKKSTFRKFFTVYLFSIVIYLMVFSSFFKGHNYYQMPYVYLVAFCIANALLAFFSFLSRLFKFEYLKAGAFLVLVFSMGTVQESINLAFDTQFYGIDIAGEIIKNNTGETDRFLRLGASQHAGVCFFAERFCANIPKKTQAIEKYEKRFNSRYIYINADFMKQARSFESWDYIEKNYRIVQLGFIAPKSGSLVPVHYVLEKGKQVRHHDMSRRKPRFIKDYELTFRKVPFYVIEP